ncbi:MAG: tRNA (adenosine(37)-N6)-threonylcarbamoyltransferase complex transferase subunit TsaD, partial [Spirochaetota bacterium]
NLGFPGGQAVDRLAKKGNPQAFTFPNPSLHKGNHPYDVSYSGLKTAVLYQLDQFWNKKYEKNPANIAAAFQEAAVEMLLERLKRALRNTGLKRVVAGGGVAANSRLREKLKLLEGIEVIFPSMKLCTDNGAMIAGIGYHYFKRNEISGLNETVYSRVAAFKSTYP